MKDRNGKVVRVGDRVKVLSLPEVDYSDEDLKHVNKMLDATFEIEQIQDGCVEVTKWFESGESKYSHSLCLWPEEFELINESIHSYNTN